MNYNQNKNNSINMGSEQCCTNTSPRKYCNKKDNNADPIQTQITVQIQTIGHSKPHYNG